MRKITLFVAAVAALVLIGIGTWRIGGRESAPTSALAGASDQPPVTMMTGAMFAAIRRVNQSCGYLLQAIDLRYFVQ